MVPHLVAQFLIWYRILGFASIWGRYNGAMVVSSSGDEKRHITCTPGVCGGKPCIGGTRIRVQDIYVWQELQGQSVDEIVAKFPELTHAGVYAAMAYLWDHREQIMDEIAMADAVVGQAMQRYPSKLGPRKATGS